MKCERCLKQATYHITDVLGQAGYAEMHLCEECAKKHLADPTPPQPTAGKKTSHAAAPPSDDDLADIANKQCDACGIKFVEFRNTGRLGCPHDYDAFRDELVPLLENIHGDMRHAGKQPRRLPRVKAAQQELATLRKQLASAVTKEAYEEAARLRDMIRQVEGQ